MAGDAWKASLKKFPGRESCATHWVDLSFSFFLQDALTFF